VIHETSEMVILHIQPDTSVRNHRTEEMAKLVASFYRVPGELWHINERKIHVRPQSQVSMKMVYKKGDISFYLVLPIEQKSAFLRRLESLWERATVTEVTALPTFDERFTVGAEVHYTRHEVFSIQTDHRNNNPLPSLFAPIREFEDGDTAVFDVLMEPTNRRQREHDARLAHATLQRGKIPVFRGGFNAAEKGFEVVSSVLNFLRYSALELTATTKEQETEIKRMKRMEERDVTALRVLRELQPESKHKANADVLRVSIRALVQSMGSGRRQRILSNICSACHDLDGDNELTATVATERQLNGLIGAVENQQPFRVRGGSMRMSTDEVGKLLQLPGDDLQRMYPEVSAVRKVEVAVGSELFQDVPSIIVGTVTEKGVSKTARIPLEEYDGVRKKDVDDATCTPTFVFGKMGVGKTDGVGAGQALDMIKAGYTAFLLDTADGQVAKTLTDALPEDYPEEKLIYLDYRDVKRAIPLTYADVAGTVSGVGDDAELSELQMATRLTSHQQEFLNKQSATGELTDRMRRYFVSAAKAARGRPLHIELALESPSYREELLSDPFVQCHPDVVGDLLALQDKAESGGDRAVVDPILERLRMLSRNPFLANVFLTDDVRDESGEVLLNFRRYADNPEGGYGYCVVIVCDKDTYGPEGQELICSTVQSKIFLAAYSRIDQDQSERKPFISIADEPHRFIRGGAARRLYSDAAVELRKYRCRTVMLAHSPEQLGEVWDAFSSGGAQIIAYKSENMNDYRKLNQQFAPYDAEYVYQNLAEKWEAVCKLRLPSGKESPAFFAKMAPPPDAVKDRSARREECGHIFGYHWKDARDRINGLRSKYQDLDVEWFARKAEEEAKRKKIERDRKRAEREQTG